METQQGIHGDGDAPPCIHSPVYYGSGAIQADVTVPQLLKEGLHDVQHYFELAKEHHAVPLREEKERGEGGRGHQGSLPHLPTNKLPEIPKC